MIVILSFPFYKIVSYTYMGIRIAFNSDLRIHNCWEWANTPIWWSWKVKRLSIDYGTCSYPPWIVSFDLSRYKNLKSLYVGERSFKYVKRFKLKGLKKLESVDIGYHSLKYPSSIIFESEEMEWMIRLDLPKLQSIRLSRYALEGSYSNENSLIMNSSELVELIMRLAFIVTSIWTLE